MQTPDDRQGEPLLDLPHPLDCGVTLDPITMAGLNEVARRKKQTADQVAREGLRFYLGFALPELVPENYEVDAAILEEQARVTAGLVGAQVPQAERELELLRGVADDNARLANLITALAAEQRLAELGGETARPSAEQVEQGVDEENLRLALGLLEKKARDLETDLDAIEAALDQKEEGGADA